MNTTLDNTFESNLRGKYNDLIALLGSNDIKKKHFAVLELEEIKSRNDAKILVSNLINQDGKIREVVAFKINEFCQNPQYIEYFIDEDIFSTILQGIMDINGNICRYIVTCGLFNNKDFQAYLCSKLPESIIKILEVIQKLDKNEKQYKISKRNFQLYWCLEALSNIIDVISFDAIKQILFETGEFEDYTIREKTAKILSKINNPEIENLKNKLKNDENYYVRRFLESN